MKKGSDGLSTQNTARASTMSALCSITDSELVGKSHTPPKLFLGNWLRSNALNLIYAWRGTGKTFFCLSIAYAIASGSSFLRWPFKNRARIRYIDGELGEVALKNMYSAIVMGAERDYDGGGVHFTSLEQMGGIPWNLADSQDLVRIKPLIEPFDIVFLDNLSALVRPIGRETEVQAWSRVRSWLNAWRAAGKCFIIVHHAGKSGTQRGTSEHEDGLDFVLRLSSVHGSTPGVDTTFEVTFEKVRAKPTEDYIPMNVQMLSDENGVTWLWRNAEDAQWARIQELQARGLKAYDIAELLGLTTSKVKYLINKRGAPCYEDDSDSF